MVCLREDTKIFLAILTLAVITRNGGEVGRLCRHWLELQEVLQRCD